MKITVYPESRLDPYVRITRACGWTWSCWQEFKPQITPDKDQSGALVYQFARQTWVPKLEDILGYEVVLGDQSHIDRKKRYIVVANHASILDIPIMVRADPNAVFVAKYDIVRAPIPGIKGRVRFPFGVPVIGPAVRRCGQITVLRTNTERDARSLQTGIEDRPKANVIFFAEGTRNPEGELGPFKSGAFWSAVNHKLPILPVLIHGSHKLLGKNMKWSDYRPGKTIRVTYLDPIAHDAYSSPQKLMHEVHAYMHHEYNRLRPNPP